MSGQCWDLSALFDDEDVTFDYPLVLFDGAVAPSVPVWADPCKPISPFGEGMTLVIDEDGEWAIDDDPLAIAEGYFVIDADGDLAIDDAVPVGQLATRLDPESDPIAYSTDDED